MKILGSPEMYIARFPSLHLSLSLGKSLIFGEILAHYVYDALAALKFNELILNSIAIAAVALSGEKCKFYTVWHLAFQIPPLSNLPNPPKPPKTTQSPIH